MFYSFQLFFFRFILIFCSFFLCLVLAYFCVFCSWHALILICDCGTHNFVYRSAYCSLSVVGRQTSLTPTPRAISPQDIVRIYVPPAPPEEQQLHHHSQQKGNLFDGFLVLNGLLLFCGVCNLEIFFIPNRLRQRSPPRWKKKYLYTCKFAQRTHNEISCIFPSMECMCLKYSL